MSPVSLALIARAVVLLAVLLVGREIAGAVMHGVVAAAGTAVPAAPDAERLVGLYRFPATLLAMFLGVVAAQAALRLKRSRAGAPGTLWLSLVLAVACALAAPGLLWARAGAEITEYPELMRGMSVALSGFLPPVAAMAAAGWWWVATTLPLPGKAR